MTALELEKACAPLVQAAADRGDAWPLVIMMLGFCVAGVAAYWVSKQ